MVKIYIDPGHGGTDPGAVGNGLQEKALTLAIGLKTRDILVNEFNNAEVRMSRTTDTTVSLSQRSADANAWGANYFVSIHINAGGGTGYEDFVYTGSGAPTTTYQNIMHEEILKQVDFSDRGKKQANFAVLRETNMPAILTENGFIDNVNDTNKLKQAAFIDRLARGHANGIARAFNLSPKSSAVYHTVVSGDTVYGLSQRYGSTPEQIRTWNNLNSTYTIYVGQVLRVK